MSRLLLPKLITLLIFAALISRLYQLQLVDTEANRLRYATQVRTTRYLAIRPMRGEIFASDGTTLLAESVPIFTVAIRPADLPPEGSYQRAEGFAHLSQLLGITSTLILSPAIALEQDAVLRNDLIQGLGADVVEAARRRVASTSLPAASSASQPATNDPLMLMVSPPRSLAALKLSDYYSATLSLRNPIAERIENSNIPGYQTMVIKEDISRELALVLRENSASLPGVTVDEDYRRRYPLSVEMPSLSHLLGYIGRVGECELVRKNPARSWVVGLLDSIGHAPECGVIQKQINPRSLGMPRYLSEDRIGKDGLESSYEEHLRGQLGLQALLVDALGQPVRAPQVIQPARDGDNLVLTIDVPFQRQVEQILRAWIDEGERRRLNQSGQFAYKRDYPPIRAGVAIVMEVRTGRILAMVSWPSYDNNIWAPDRAEELQRAFYPADPRAQRELARLAPLTNRAIAGQYPPGSTLKQFDAAIALQSGVIAPDTKIHDPGKLIVEDKYAPGRFYQFVNASSRAWGDITVSDALKVSSNIFFMSVAGGNADHVVNLKPEEQNIKDGLGIDRFAEGLRWFGFGEPTGIRLAREQQGRIPTPIWKQQVLREAWTTGDTYNAAIGQGNLEVTPLQLIAAAAAIANDGALYRPQIVRAITDREGKLIQEITPELLRQTPIDPRLFTVVREGMRRSVTEGANRAARDDCSGLAIGGKTGTAEFGPVIRIPTPDGKGVREVRQSHSWFVGFAPYDNPQIEVLALVEGTGDLGDGSATIATPAVTQIMQAYFNSTPPNPLPAGCQQGMPPLPPRVDSSHGFSLPTPLQKEP